MKVLVSACLLGLNTRYDGKNTKNETLIEYLIKNNIDFYPLCAEQLGGLSTPREPSEIRDGEVFSKSGDNVTKNFKKGGNLIIKFCKKFGITHAILQDRSPSCGYKTVYDGTFTGNLIAGQGILTTMLIDNGIKIIDNII